MQILFVDRKSGRPARNPRPSIFGLRTPLFPL